MADLPTGLVEGQAGHISWHEGLHDKTNLAGTPNPLALAANAAVGTAEKLARADHVHPRTELALAADLVAHEADSTAVHGITDTAQLALKNAANTFTQAQTIFSPALGTVPLLVQAFAGQTADLQQWKGSNGSNIIYIDSAGTIKWGPGTNRAGISAPPSGGSQFNLRFQTTALAGVMATSLELDRNAFLDGETALMISRNVGGVYSVQKVSMGVTDSGGAGFKLLRVPN